MGDDLVNAMGRATIESVLQLSAEQVAGPPQQGRRRGRGDLLAWEAGRQRVLERAEVENEAVMLSHVQPTLLVHINPNFLNHGRPIR